MILAFIELDGSHFSTQSLSLLEAAKRAKESGSSGGIKVCVVGANGVQVAAGELAGYQQSCQVEEVIYAEHDTFEKVLPEYLAEFAASLVEAEKASTVLFASSSLGKATAPRVAALLEAGQASDVLDFLPDGILKRPMNAGNLIAHVEVLTAVQVLTVRLSAFPTPEKGGESCVIRRVEHKPSDSYAKQFVSATMPEKERPQLGDADIVVSGGRALKSEENFDKLLSPLADLLKAALGASRAAVDSGFAPNDWQVGQTGKIVAPKLYIAVGISGAIQHLAGMRDSKVIVAINNDPDAPIFEVADYGLVADLFEAIPEFTRILQEREPA